MKAQNYWRRINLLVKGIARPSRSFDQETAMPSFAKVALATVVVGALASCTGEKRYTIVGGPVVGEPKNGVNGSFRITEVQPAGIPSERLGGACIVFAAKDLSFHDMARKKCVRNSDCVTPGEAEKGVYCHKPTNTCWAKPVGDAADQALCERSKDFPRPKNWDVNKDHPISANPVSLRPFGIEKGARARVVACLGRAYVDPAQSGCASMDGPDRIEAMGPVVVLH